MQFQNDTDLSANADKQMCQARNAKGWDKCYIIYWAFQLQTCGSPASLSLVDIKRDVANGQLLLDKSLQLKRSVHAESECVDGEVKHLVFDCTGVKTRLKLASGVSPWSGPRFPPD